MSDLITLENADYFGEATYRENASRIYQEA